jgi:cytochrome P450
VISPDFDAAVALPTVRAHPFDPPAELGSLRSARPLCPLRYPDGRVGWLVTSYELAKAVLRDSRFGVLSGPAEEMTDGDAEPRTFVEAFDRVPERAGNLLKLNPPRHTKIRRLQAGHFRVSRVSEHRRLVEDVVAESLDAMENAGPPVDLVAMFARPIPAHVLCELLGMPRSDRDVFVSMTDTILDQGAVAESQRIDALHAFFDYCRRLIRQKRAEPADDLLSELIRRDEATDEELVGIVLTVLTAGHETTASQTALSVFCLLSGRSRWQALQTAPDSVDAVVDELLRYLSIFHRSNTRAAVQDVELAGSLIKAGDLVTVSLAAANRDPAKFENPDELDLSRAAGDHLAFGQGAHICLGQHLARLELQVGISGLLGRFPGLRLAVPAGEVPRYDDARVVLGLRELPVTW